MAHQFINAEVKQKVEDYSLLCVKAILTPDEVEKREELMKEILQAMMAVNTAKGFKIKYVELLKVKDELVSPNLIPTHSAWLGTYEVITKILGEDP